MIDSEFLRKNKNLLKPILIIVLILLVDIVFILRSQIVSLSETISRGSTLAGKIKDTRKNINSKDKLKRQYAGLRQRLSVMKDDIINEGGIPLFLSDIAQVASDTGVRLMQIRPSGLIQEGSAGGEEIFYFRLPIHVNLKCGYHQMVNFISRLEAGNRYVRFVSLDVSSVSDKPFQYPVRATIETLVAGEKTDEK